MIEDPVGGSRFRVITDEHRRVVRLVDAFHHVHRSLGPVAEQFRVAIQHLRQQVQGRAVRVADDDLGRPCSQRTLYRCVGLARHRLPEIVVVFAVA